MKSRVILLVEDNPDDEMLTLRAFKKNSIANEVIVARDGAEALEYLFGTGQYAKRDLSIMPAVILLDLKLPKLGGLEVLRHFKEHPKLKLIPVIILTSSSKNRDITIAYEYGANSYIVKPVDFDKFVSVASEIEVYWLATTKLPE